jgi:large subunit ribosomal protein L15
VKLHDLRPAEGSRVARTRVGRGIAAGKGKTAGRGTKGQKARAGGSIPPWFEGGQTPLHMRIPKLRGFKNRGKIDYEIVNVGDIDARVEAGAFAKAGATPKKGEQLTINADVLRAVGLVRDVRKPLKILGGGELATALFVVADAFTKSAQEKIEAAGGTVSILETPKTASKALGVDGEVRAPREARTAAGRKAAEREVDARAAREQATADAAEATEAASAAKAAKPAKSPKASRTDEAEAAATTDDAATAEATSDEGATDDAATDEAATAEATDAGDEAAPTSEADDTDAAEADATDDENA